jgi:N-methylhydantoinase B
LSGGYPGSPNAYIWVKHGDGEDASFAISLDAMTGEQQRVSFGVFPLMGSDACYVRWNGGGGYGDPLAREPERVETDVTAGLVSEQAAAAIYGVVLTSDGSVDFDATMSARRRLMKERLDSAIPDSPAPRQLAAINGVTKRGKAE